MNALGEKIASLIAASGPIPIAQFMTIALQDPELGYYTTHDPFGAGGDFITAPEVSQMFGELLGLWIVQAWRDQGEPSPCRLVELGPGRGTLMSDALRAARPDRKFLASIEVVLIESSPVLREMQKTTLAESAVPIRWMDHFEESLADRPLFLIANEFFDALPIRQFVMTERGWCERMVTVDASGDLAFALSPIPTREMIPPDREGSPIGGVCEIGLAGQAIVSQIADAVGTNGGAALIIDYGYDKPGFGETLQAVSGHAFVEILARPGESDLSAHVDFPELAAAAWPTADTAGPVTQGEFLTRLGILQRMQSLASENPSAADSLREDLARLVDHKKMGSLFKVLSIVPFGAPTPPGFS